MSGIFFFFLLFKFNTDANSTCDRRRGRHVPLRVPSPRPTGPPRVSAMRALYTWRVRIAESACARAPGDYSTLQSTQTMNRWRRRTGRRDFHRSRNPTTEIPPLKYIYFILLFFISSYLNGYGGGRYRVIGVCIVRRFTRFSRATNERRKTFRKKRSTRTRHTRPDDRHTAMTCQNNPCTLRL